MTSMTETVPDALVLGLLAYRYTNSSIQTKTSGLDS